VTQKQTNEAIILRLVFL